MRWLNYLEIGNKKAALCGIGVYTIEQHTHNLQKIQTHSEDKSALALLVSTYPTLIAVGEHLVL